MRSRIISVSNLAPHLHDHYVLSAMKRIWERSGVQVRVGQHYCDDADLCFLHHDRTQLTGDLPKARAGVKVINGAVLDISKRRYSTLALSPGDAWPGPVIVKSNLNHFGLPEAGAERATLISALHRRLARLSWRMARKLPERFYPVLESIGDVPNWVWRDENLLVEKFLPERTEDGLYSIRGWLFLGDQSYGYRMYSPDPLVKTGTMVRHDYLDAPPPELVEIRKRMQFDFGKFDYVQHGEQAILLDANKTPTYSGKGESPRLLKLAQGIEAFFA